MVSCPCFSACPPPSLALHLATDLYLSTDGTKTQCVTWVFILGDDSDEVATQFKCGTDDVTSTLYSSTGESSQSSSSQASSSASSSNGLSWLDPTTRHSTSRTSATTLPTSLTNGTSSTTTHGVSGGVVGGITAGTVALVAFAAFLVYWIVQKRRTTSMAIASRAHADASINEDYGGAGAGAAAVGGAGAGGFLSRIGLGRDAGVPVLKGGPVTSAMAVGATGGAYLQDQKYQQFQMQQHLLAHDDTGAAGGNPISQPPTGAWGLPGGSSYYPMQDQNPGSVYDGAGYGPRLGGAPLYDPQAAAAGAALPTSRPYPIQHRPAEM